MFLLEKNVYVTYSSEGWLKLGWFSSEWWFFWMWLVSLMLLWPAAVWKVKVKVVQSCPTFWDTYSPWNSPGQNTGVSSLSLLQGIFPTQGLNPGLLHCKGIIYQLRHKVAAKSFQSCPTLCDPIDDSPPGSPVPGILQARTLELVAISFSNAWKWKVKVMSLSRVRLIETPWTAAYQAPLSMGFSRQEYWSGVPSRHKVSWSKWAHLEWFWITHPSPSSFYSLVLWNQLFKKVSTYKWYHIAFIVVWFIKFSHCTL